jgi:hypothetical protein
MRTRWVVGAALVMASCKDETAAQWAGAYDGSVLIEAFDCETGEQLEPDAFDGVLTVGDLGDRITVNGDCPIILTKTGDGTASIVPSSCDDVLSDGTPIHAENLGGSASIDGDTLRLNVSRRLERGGLCDSTRETFVGTRR